MSKIVRLTIAATKAVIPRIREVIPEPLRGTVFKLILQAVEAGVEEADRRAAKLAEILKLAKAKLQADPKALEWIETLLEEKK